MKAIQTAKSHTLKKYWEVIMLLKYLSSLPILKGNFVYSFFFKSVLLLVYASQ